MIRILWALVACLVVAGASTDVERSTDILACGKRTLDTPFVPPPPPPDIPGEFLDQVIPPHIPQNESAARALQQRCIRYGWKYGRDSWACGTGYRLPTTTEYTLVSSCITATDTSRFGYYYDIGVAPGPNGCYCKWNAGWCGQPSIDTIRGGRMCGDYTQLHICVLACNGNPPNPPANYYRTVSGTTAMYYCNAGYYGTAGETCTCSSSWTCPSFPSCIVCPIGSYCPGGTSAASPTLCPAGTFGNSIGRTSPSCSGSCTAGYYCPAGSTTSTAFQCGGTGNNYCPTGSGAPLQAPAGTYTTPLSYPVTLRTGYATCPTNRACSGGVILPGVDYSGTCAAAQTASLPELTANADFGPTVTPTTPGCACGLNYYLSVTPIDATCSASTVRSSLTFNTVSGKLRSTSTAISFANCPGGFTVTITAMRTDGTGLSATCQVNVAVVQVARAPVITNCNALPVPERSPINTVVATNITATSGNVGSTLLWSIVNPAGIPFSISGCDAIVRVTQFFTYSQRTSYSVPLVVSNVGMLPVLNATCTLTIPVQRVLLPPVIGMDTFFVPELATAGVYVGNVGPASQDDGTSVQRVWFSGNDTRNNFAMDAWGNITVRNTLPTLVIQSSYRYNVSVQTTGGRVATFPVVITLTPVPQPPSTYPQTRSLFENVPGGFALVPALAATHSQLIPFNFTELLPAGSPFDVNRTGMVYLKSGQTLDYIAQKSYTLQFYLQDANGLVASSTLTISVLQVNKPPTMGAALYQMSLDEYGAEGSMGYKLIPSTTGPGMVRSNVYVFASNFDPDQGLTYAVVTANPAVYKAYIAIDPLAGAVIISGTAPGPLRFDTALSYPLPQTVVLNVSATNTGTPPLSAFTRVEVTIANIRPRLTAATFTLPGTYASNQAVGTITAWSAYATPGFTYSITQNDKDTRNANAFAIASGTGVLSLAGMPAFDFNVKNRFQVIVTVTDSNGMSDSATYTVLLAWTNRPPVWLPVPRMYAAAVTAGNIGVPLSGYVTDPDVALNLGESLRFTFAPGANGNTDNTFAITTTGQIYVLNVNTPSFQYPAGATVAPTFNITVQVQDLGINGTAFTARQNVTIELTANQIPPTIGYYNLSVPELVNPGTVVGVVTGATVNRGYKLNYTLTGAGINAFSPFPFTITTFDDGVANSGRITTTNAAVIDVNVFAVYRATLTVTDNNPRSPLSNSTNIDINVLWQSRPPFFDRATRTPNSVVFTLSIAERTAGVVNVSDSPLMGWSKDPWQQPNLRYRLSAASPYFTIGAADAILRTSSQFATVDYNVFKGFNLTIIMTDMFGLTDTAQVRVSVIEINKPAVFTGLVDAANRSIAAFSVAENAPVGTVIGYVTFSDPNVYWLWRQKNYAIASDLDGATGFFGVNSATGAVFIARSGLDWWDQSSFSLVFTCQDADPLNFISVNVTAVVNLVQINTVTVTGFFVDPSATPATAVNVTGPGQMQVQFTTNGFTQRLLYITGTGFGRTQRRLTREGRAMTFTTVAARFGSFVAPSCQVVVPNTVIACSVPQGAGANHAWTVTIDGAWAATSTATTGYFPPTITSVYRQFGVQSDPSTQTITTRGIDFLLVSGANIGPAGTQVYLAYGRQGVPGYESNFGSAAACTWITSQQIVKCPTVEGIGSSLKFALQVAQQQSVDFTASPVRYKRPAVAAVYAPILATRGGQRSALVIAGSDFGPSTISPRDLRVTYSKDFSNAFYTVFEAANCIVSAAHQNVTCDTVPGVGTGLAVRVHIGDQTSASSVDTVSYQPPAISALAGGGLRLAQTTGGQEIIISGSGFGPLTPLFPNGSAIPIDLQPVATYGPNAKYAAADCRVTATDTTITCLTVPGVGKGLRWSVTVGEQSSPVFTGQTSDYAPPVVATYVGSGASGAFTWGGEAVVIGGSNFGPEGTVPDNVVYTRDGNSSLFQAQNCTLTAPHREITCYTAVGAGAGLKWLVTVAGQDSVTPTTSYGVPRIDSFSGPGAVDASTDGGDWVSINGQYFSVIDHLDSVTYGPSGTEFKARNCYLSQNHTQLTCQTVAGVGRVLRWYVSVGKQLSLLSAATTSYGSPKIVDATPLRANTDGTLNGQQAKVVVTGTSFALSYPAAEITIKMNNLNVAAPVETDVAAHWSSVLAGGSGLASVSSWISQLTTIYPDSRRTLSNNLHQVSFFVPQGFGANAHVFAIVGGIPSNITMFSYERPVITNIAPDRQNVTQGFVRIWVEGRSFCDGRNGCGRVYMNNVTFTPAVWSHTQLMFVGPDPQYSGSDALVIVEVGGVASAPFPFRRPAPSINALSGTQGTWKDMDTRGGQRFFITGISDIAGLNESVSIAIGGRPCTNQWGYIDNGLPITDPAATMTLECKTPAGVGLNLPIIVTYNNVSSRDDANFRFSYAAPSLDSAMLLLPFYSGDMAELVNSSIIALPDVSTAIPLAASGVSTLGGVVVVTGSNLGIPSLGAGMLVDQQAGVIMPILSQNHTSLVALLPPGDGVVHSMRYSVGQQSSGSLPYSYAAPSLVALVPNHGPTRGGTVVKVVVRNAGITRPLVTFGGANCTIVEPFNVSANHSEVFCMSPRGQGRDLDVSITVNGQTSAASNVKWSFDPPIVTAVLPPSGPTSGRQLGPLLADNVHRAQGPRIVQIVSGINFGTSGSLSYQPYSASDPLARAINVPAADILSWNDSTIVYLMPEGFGYSLLVSVYASQPSSSSVEFSYLPPMISAITRFDRSPDQCRPITQCFTFGNTTRCRKVDAGCFDCVGRYPIEIVGENFGIQSILSTFTQVFVGPNQCIMPTDPATLVQLSHERLVCTAPSGLGEDNVVAIKLGTRMNVHTNASFFRYDSPFVASVQPNTPDARGAQLQLRGKNFGGVATHLNITINNQMCTTMEWLNDAQLACRAPAQTVGTKNVSITVANRTEPYQMWDVAEELVYQCTKDFYGMEGENCLACPQGAKCPGAERLVDLVNATSGFWRMNVSSTSEEAQMFCDPERRDTREFCPAFLPCGPVEACLADNVCAEGYEGERCANCLKGKYYRVNDQCIKCPSNTILLYVGIAVLLLCIVAFAWFLNKRNVSLALIAVGVDWAQVMSMFARTKIRWPTLLRQLFQVLSAFNLNLEITAPECLNPEITFYQKWFFVESVPLVASVVLLIGVSASYLYNRAILRAPAQQRWAALPKFVATAIVLFRLLYLYLTKTSFDVLNCTPTDPPTFRDPVTKKDAIEYMSGLVQPDYECWAKNSWQVTLFPFGVATLSVYTFLVPGLALWHLWRNKELVKIDQILRARSLGDDTLSNPRAHGFRQMWQKLYYHYLPGKWYWEFCITARKMFVAGITLAFRQVPSYQLAIALLVLFTAYVLHVIHWPHMSHTTRPRVVEDHLAKAAAGDRLHAKIESDMRAAFKKNFRVRRQSNLFDRAASGPTTTASAVMLRAFDSNTVEAILLASCVLVSLAGIMLESKRFDGDNWYLPQVQREYTGLTFGCLMIIVGSIIYYAVVFAIEMCLVFCPAAVPHLLSMCSCSRRSKASASDNGIRRKASLRDLADGLKEEESTFMHNNMAAAEIRTLTLRDPASRRQMFVLDPADVARIQMPSPAAWKSIQIAYMRAVEIANARSATASDGTEVADGDEVDVRNPIAVPKSRTQFLPLESADNGELAPVKKPKQSMAARPASSISLSSAAAAAVSGMASNSKHKALKGKRTNNPISRRKPAQASYEDSSSSEDEAPNTSHHVPNPLHSASSVNSVADPALPTSADSALAFIHTQSLSGAQ